jgi:hypothetical protein
MHNLSSAFVLGYHGCDRKVAEQLLNNEPFVQSSNKYDWLGSGIYLWEANPDRAWAWALEQSPRLQKKGIDFEPEVVGAVIDLGLCLDLTTSNGISAIQSGYRELRRDYKATGVPLPTKIGGANSIFRQLDCAVVDYVHAVWETQDSLAFDSVRGLFSEGRPAYKGAKFKTKNHVQICERHQENIHGVFRVNDRYFSAR